MAAAGSKSINRRTVLAWLFLLLIVGGIAADGAWEISRPLNLAEDTIVEVRSGETLRGVVAHLRTQGIVDFQQGFILGVAARFNRTQSAIRAGEYKLVRGTDIFGLAQLLRSGKVILHEIRFIEGWRFSQ